MAAEVAGQVDEQQLRRVCQLWEEGLYLQAYRASQAWGELSTWRGTRARILAGRMAIQLGAPTLSMWLLRRVWQEDPSDAEAQYYYATCVWYLRGPYWAWRWMACESSFPEDAPAELCGAWLGLRASVAGMLRDFEAAEMWLERAFAAAPESAWVEVCRSQVLEAEDRYEEALAAARRALQMRRWYRPAVQAAGHLLMLLGRDEEALELLSEAAEHLESGLVVALLYGLQMELQRFEEARESLDRCAALLPLADRRMRKWLAAQRCEVAYRLGDFQGAIKAAEACDDELWRKMAERLRDPQLREAPAKILPVGFVRQHQSTCAPATLAAISRYWSMPADHLQVAEEICYDGTSHYSERKWAEDHGWVTREFTVTEESARALVDRGIPFTLTTVDPGSAHLQAVIGYDARRGTLIVRDPMERGSREVVAEEFLRRYRAYGPRGMALVPAAQRRLLEELELPDAPLWDQLHALDRALMEHRREEAQRVYDAMRAAAGDHCLVHEARRRLAAYDDNPMEQLAAIEQLQKAAPDDAALELARLACLRHLARREERLAAYRALANRPNPHPIVWQQYAQELRFDARRHDDAIWLLRRAIRRWPSDPANYYILANIYWEQRRFDEALPLYRFATCLGDKEEQFAHAYFMACLCRKQTDRALRLLSDRFERFGSKSSLPGRTLFSAYMQLGRMQDGLRVLEEALRRRPDDGQLLLMAADAYPSCSAEYLARGEALLQQARDKVPLADWHRTAARVATLAGRLPEALQHWQQVLRLQPLALDAHQEAAQLLAETQGRAAALEQLEKAIDRFPHHHGLYELWMDWIAEEPLPVRERVLRRVLQAYPEDARARRELALVLASQRRFPEAWQQLEVAGQVEPPTPEYHLSCARVLEAEGKLEEAKATLRQAIELSVDEERAVVRLVQLCHTADQRRQALAFVKSQLEKQVTLGDGLIVFRLCARETLRPDELLAVLQEALDARPDLWHAWSAMAAQLTEMDRLDEAWKLAVEATERFPLMPRVWLDCAMICHARGDALGELEALQTAYQIAPRWGTAVRALAELYQRRGEYERARRFLEQAIAHNPLDAYHHLMLAETLWRLGQREAALQRLERAVQLEPGCEPAWVRLEEWTDQLGCPERALRAAQQLTQIRAGEPRSWLMLAHLLEKPDQWEQRLEALDRAVELDPRCEDAYDLRAVTLAGAGRWEEALEACQPPAWGDYPPVALRARAAWIEARRGDLRGAVSRMRALVGDEPQYYEGWLRLAEWYSYLDDGPAYLEAAETLTRLRPHEEVSFACLGDARRQNGDLAGARQAFQRALELAPAYEPAGVALFDLQMEQGDLDGAEATLANLQVHVDSAAVVSCQVRLAVRRGDRQAACEALRRLCLFSHEESEAPLHAAVEAFQEAGWLEEADAVLEAMLDEPGSHRAVPSYWVRVRTARGQWGLGLRLRKLADQSPAGAEATYAYIDQLVQTRAAGRLKRFIRRHQQWLRAHTATWGAVAYGLTAFRRFRQAARWTSDWLDRPDAQPWMLVNAAEAFRATGREAEGGRISRHALTLPPGYGQHLHHLWLAADAALLGRGEEAQRHLQYVEAHPLDEDYQFLLGVVQCVLEMDAAPPPARRETFRQLRRRLVEARAKYRAFGLEPARRRYYWRALARIAKRRGTVLARLWYAFRRLADFAVGR